MREFTLAKITDRANTYLHNVSYWNTDSSIWFFFSKYLYMKKIQIVDPEVSEKYWRRKYVPYF